MTELLVFAILLRVNRLSLIQRRIFFDLFKVTILSLVGVSTLLMMASAMLEASRKGLDPMTVLSYMPYLIAPTLAYTIPTCLLFAVVFVYGGLSGSNEIVALKAGGVHPLRILTPAILLSILLGAGGVFLVDRWAPHSNNQVREMIFNDIEGLLYARLKSTGKMVESGFPFELYVREVRNKRLIKPVIRHINPKTNEADWVIHSDEATLAISQEEDTGLRYISVTFQDGSLAHRTERTVHFTNRTERMPLPANLDKAENIQLEVLTFDGCYQYAQQKKREQTEMKFEICRLAAESLFNLPHTPEEGEKSVVQNNNPKQSWMKMYRFHEHRLHEIERCERKTREATADVQIRIAQATSTIPFILLGLPISILFRRSDFLQNFFMCFLPIIVAFYPAMILMFNVYKEGHGSLIWTTWSPTMVLIAVSIPLIRRVIRY